MHFPFKKKGLCFCMEKKNVKRQLLVSNRPIFRVTGRTGSVKESPKAIGPNGVSKVEDGSKIYYEPKITKQNYGIASIGPRQIEAEIVMF